MAFDSGPGETLSRFLTDRDQYSSKKAIVRHTAFFPPRDNRLSVFWITGFPDNVVWRLGDTYVARTRGPVIGQAVFNSLVVYDTGLAVDLTGVPHERHADIIGWDADRKRARLQAHKVADKALLVLRH